MVIFPFNSNVTRHIHICIVVDPSKYKCPHCLVLSGEAVVSTPIAGVLTRTSSPVLTKKPGTPCTDVDEDMEAGSDHAPLPREFESDSEHADSEKVWV